MQFKYSQFCFVIIFINKNVKKHKIISYKLLNTYNLLIHIILIFFIFKNQIIFNDINMNK